MLTSMVSWFMMIFERPDPPTRHAQVATYVRNGVCNGQTAKPPEFISLRAAAPQLPQNHIDTKYRGVGVPIRNFVAAAKHGTSAPHLRCYNPPIMSTHASLKVNGQTHVVDVDPDCPLLYVLRDNLALNNPRFGCGLGQCGACTVIVDDRAVRSCLLPVSRAIGKEIVTLEGLGTPGTPHPVQTAFIEEQTFQCGYCLNGWVMSTKAFLDKNPNPSDADVRKAFETLVCRCGSHARIFSAVHRAAAGMKRSA
jgi:nicotinate dehydrogenase subunit A